jgi:hypothetical protein
MSNFLTELWWCWLEPGTIFVVLFSFWMGMFTYLDFLNPIWWQRVSINNPRPKISVDVLRKTVPVVTKNLMFSLIFMTVLWMIRIQLTTKSLSEQDLSVWVFWTQLLGCYILSETAFTINHGVAHLFGKSFHALHHEFDKPWAICSFYCGFWEMLLLNLPVAELGPIMLGVHPYVHMTWLIMSGTYVSFDHCGHQIGPIWIFDTTYHDQHHANPAIHHGSHLWDRLLHTR